MRINVLTIAGLLAIGFTAACNADATKVTDSESWDPDGLDDDLTDSDVNTDTDDDQPDDPTDDPTDTDDPPTDTDDPPTDTDDPPTDTEPSDTDDCEEYETYYYDNDGDGWGDPDKTAEYCTDDEVPPYWVDNSWDCDDSNSGEPVWVDDDASSGGTGSYTYPFQTVQDGIDEADVCVYVMDGYYNEDIDFSGKDILVMGVDGADNTTIEGTGTTSVVTFADEESSDAVLQGFTITGGIGTEEVTSVTWTCDSTITCEETYYRYYGCGVYIEQAEPTLVDLIISENECAEESTTEVDEYTEVVTTSYGGAIAVINGAPSLESVDMTLNYAYTGGALYLNDGSSVTSVWSETTENGAGIGGGYYAVGSLEVGNSILCGNDATDGNGGGVDVAGGSVVLSYTNLVANLSSDAHLHVSEAGTVEVWNSIITDNSSGDEVYTESGVTGSWYYSDVYDDNWDGYYSSQSGSNGNVSVDPDFTSWSGDCGTADFSLASSSALIDAGDPSDSDADGSTADMGAYGGPEGSW